MKTRYTFKDETCIIENFDQQAAFSSFLPGLAGIKGCPMWAYYVNRGQGICSFGVHDKANAMMEFNPANLGYRRISQDGFRTFVKINGAVHEFFTPTDDAPERVMIINMNSLELEEKNERLGICINVKYFILPNEDFPALVRRVHVTNISQQEMTLELLDGIGQIIPYGIQNSGFKEMSNLNKSWAEITWHENLPLFHTRSIPGDEAEVEESISSYFAISTDGDGSLLRPITDTRVLFGEDETQAFPWNFKTKTIAELKAAPEYTINRYPCVFTPIEKTLEVGQGFCLTTYFGYASAPEVITNGYERLLQASYIDKAEETSDRLTKELTNAISTSTSSNALNGYFRQSFLDNVLRGGYPVIMGKQNKKTVHLYVRKHGDPERDYNFFSLSAEPYSQGNGNFRDVNQNRRNDVFFVPEAGEFNVCTFMSLIGADGYNPLEVKGIRFKNDEGKPFTVGELYLSLKKQGLDPDANIDEMLDKASECFEAEYREGYWSDHFTYNLDLIETYSKIFPDKMHELLFNDRKCRYFRCPVEVLSRSERYGFVNGKLRQRFSLKKIATPEHNWLTDVSGNDATISIFGKLMLLTALKYSSLDPYGCGVEMDGGKPGWNDAMNGVPFLFGSGMSETFELKRIICFLLEQKLYGKVRLPIELYNLIKRLDAVSEIENRFEFWQKRNDEREAYREQLYKNASLSGEFAQMDESEISRILTRFLKRIDDGITYALNLGGGIVPTFLVFEAAEIVDNMPKAFSCRALPLFLEGPVRMMKTVDKQTASEIHKLVTQSACYDEKLKMYKTSEPLDGEGYEIGRIRAFTAGWLERESVFLHMSYKYIYGLIRAGLYDEFYEAAETGFVPFMDPEVYGRSTLENSSFIASSSNPDPTVHGRGYVSRLSGSTSEVLSMWIEMFIGKKCFWMDAETLCLTFEPKLKGELFKQDGTISFMFLGKIPVVYLNPERKNTYGENGLKPHTIIIKDENGAHTIQGDTIRGEFAHKIRNCEGIIGIEIHL